MNDSDLVTVKTASSGQIASLWTQALLNEGIPAFCDGHPPDFDNALDRSPVGHLVWPVRVPRDRLRRAREILDAMTRPDNDE